MVFILPVNKIYSIFLLFLWLLQVFSQVVLSRKMITTAMNKHIDMPTITVTELAFHLALTKRSVQRKAIKENWPYVMEIGLGGNHKAFKFKQLPTIVRTQVIDTVLKQHQNLGYLTTTEQAVHPVIDHFLNYTHASNDATWLQIHIFSRPFTLPQDKTTDKNYIKIGLVVLAKLYVNHFNLNKISGFDQFTALYNAKAFNLHSQVYKGIKHISRISLLRWEKHANLQTTISHSELTTLVIRILNNLGQLPFTISAKYIYLQLGILVPNCILPPAGQSLSQTLAQIELIIC